MEIFIIIFFGFFVIGLIIYLIHHENKPCPNCKSTRGFHYMKNRLNWKYCDNCDYEMWDEYTEWKAIIMD